MRPNPMIVLDRNLSGTTLPEMNVPKFKDQMTENLEEDNYDDNDLTELLEILQNLHLAPFHAARFRWRKFSVDWRVLTNVSWK